MQQNISDFHDACRAVLTASKTSRALDYAVGYASAGLRLSDSESIRVQCLYILNNISHWRGPIASVARGHFKRLSLPKAWKGAAA